MNMGQSESSESPTTRESLTSITACVKQLCTGEDIVPRYLETAENVGAYFGDGHTGSGCADIIEAHWLEILTAIVENGAGAGMALADRLCANQASGAMFTTILFERERRRMTIVSRGDCSTTVYQGGEVVHEQRHHSYSSVENDTELSTAAATMGIVRNTDQLGPKFLPSSDGKTMDIENASTYFEWTGHPNRIQAASFLGHRGLARLPPFVTTLELGSAAFHLVGSSDGVADVINCRDATLATPGVSADEIVQEATKRWTTPFFAATTQSEFEDNNEGDHFIINPRATETSWSCEHDGELRAVKLLGTHVDGTSDVRLARRHILRNVEPARLHKKLRNQGADDMSALVMNVAASTASFQKRV